MEFYLKLANKQDDKKLEGIVLFEDFGKEFYKDCGAVLTLGVGKDEYYISSNEELYIPYVYDIEKIFERISSILPNARICYVSFEDEGTGESDVMLKMENDSKIYHCGTLWFDSDYPDIGDDEWCDKVKEQTAEEEAELEEMMRQINK